MRSLFAYAFILFACSSMTFATKPLHGTTSNTSQKDGRSPASGYCINAKGLWEAAPTGGTCPNGAEPYRNAASMCLDGAGSWENPNPSTGKCANGSEPAKVNFR